MRFLKSTNSIYIFTSYLIQACFFSTSLNAQSPNNDPKLELLDIGYIEFVKDVKYIEDQIYVAASFHTSKGNKDSTRIVKTNNDFDIIWSTNIGNEENTYPTELLVIDNKTYVIAYLLADLKNQEKFKTLLLYEINNKGEVTAKKELGKTYGKQTTSTAFNKNLLISYYPSKDSINVISVNTKNLKSTSINNNKFEGTIKEFIIFNNNPLFVYQNNKNFIFNELKSDQFKTKVEIPFNNGKAEGYGAINITGNKTLNLFNFGSSSDILKYELNDKFEYKLIKEIKLPVNYKKDQSITNLKIFNGKLWCFYKNKNSQNRREYALLKFLESGEIKKIDLSGVYISSYYINHDILIAGKTFFTKNLSSFKTTKFYSPGDEIVIDLDID